MHATEALYEADRLMTVCNSCRYCEGICAVFPAMEMRRSFQDADLNYLANLCHSCGACYYDCQFAPPHEFNVNVPKVLAQVRNQSYATYAWPKSLAPLFARNGLVVSFATSLAIGLFIAGFMTLNDPSIMFGTHAGPGAFYKLMPHNVMAGLFGAVSLYAVVALVMGFRAFWRDIGKNNSALVGYTDIWQAIRDAGELRYLDGGGVGCMNETEHPNDGRRLYHHLTFYGFALCFASTSVATFYHYVLDRHAPYPWYDLPVLLGTIGGIGLIIGPIGLLRAKTHRDPALRDTDALGMENAFTSMLLLVSVTGLLLLVLRTTPLMGTLLAIHLGFVMGLFLTVPYGKAVHGLYRFGALVNYARERRKIEAGGT